MMYIQKFIQIEFGALIDKKHNKTLDQIMSDFWQDASKGIFIPPLLGGHGKMNIKVFLEDDVEHAFYYVGEKKRLELFTSNGRKLTEYMKKKQPLKVNVELKSS